MKAHKIFPIILLLVGWLPWQAHATATYEASAFAQANIVGVSILDPATGAPSQIISEDDWEEIIQITYDVLSYSDSSDFSPVPDNIGSGSRGWAAAAYGWNVFADVSGEVSVPGFAESSQISSLRITVQNLNSVETVQVDVLGNISIFGAANLALPSELLEGLMATAYAEIDGDGITYASLTFGEMVGPYDGSNGPIEQPNLLNMVLAPSGVGYLTIFAEVSGRVSSTAAVPEPATFALFSLGLAGIPFVRRRRTPA